MNETKYYYRGKMLHLFLEKEYSPSIKREISCRFKNMKEEEKEKLAKVIVPIIEKSTTEQEVKNKIRRLVKHV